MRSLAIGAAMAALAGCGGPDADHGATVYTASCAACHGSDGTGAVAGVADLTVRVAEMTDAEIEDNVNNGGGDMAAVPLSEDDLADLLAYLRETFGGGA